MNGGVPQAALLEGAVMGSNRIRENTSAGIDDDGAKSRTLSNRNEAIVALKGDGLFWIFFQSVKVFKQEEGAQTKARMREYWRQNGCCRIRLLPMLLPATTSSDGKDKSRCKR